MLIIRFSLIVALAQLALSDHNIETSGNRVGLSHTGVPPGACTSTRRALQRLGKGFES